MRLLKIVIVHLLLLFVLLACSPSKKINNNTLPDAGVDKNKLLQGLNEVRTNGCRCSGSWYAPVKSLSWNDKLQKAAAHHSNYMKQSGNLSHYGKNHSSVTIRLKNIGYRWSFIAENIAQGQRDEDEVIKSWLQSPGHCKNIMDKNVSEIGAAKSGNFWTLVLASP